MMILPAVQAQARSRLKSGYKQGWNFGKQICHSERGALEERGQRNVYNDYLTDLNWVRREMRTLGG